MIRCSGGIGNGSERKPGGKSHPIRHLIEFVRFRKSGFKPNQILHGGFCLTIWSRSWVDLAVMLLEDVCRLLRKRFPILRTVVEYSSSDLAPDALAGLTVGLMLIPQSIAYASLAGLEPQFGLYSALAGGVAYALLGTVPQITIGPSAILSLLTFQFAGEHNHQAVALLAFLCGLTQLLFGLFRLGFIIDFVSMPVISGYTSAAALIIASSQVKGLLGLKFEADQFATTVYHIVRNVRKIKMSDSLLGAACLFILIGSKIIRERYFPGNAVIFYISTAKNAIVVLISTLMAYFFYTEGHTPFTLTGDIAGGLPKLKFPSLAIESEDDDSEEKISFEDIFEKFGLGIITITFISITSNIVVAKVFSRGKRLDASQEIVALGTTNVLGSFIGSMPVCASFSRGAVNNASGVKTTFGGLYTVILVLLALAVLTPSFYFIPKSTLSAVVISAVIFMIETDIFFLLWKTNKKDLIPVVGTFLSSLALGIEYGLVIGIAIDMFFLLYYTSRPSLSFDLMEVSGQQYWMITPRTGLMFPSGSYLQRRVTSEANKFEKAESTILVFNLIHVSHTDYTAGQILKSVINDIRGSFKKCVTLNGRKNVIKQLEALIPNLEHVQSLDNVCCEIMSERV